MRRYREQALRAQVQKQERIAAELARVRERLDREEEERRERRALQARIEERKLEKQRAEIAEKMRRKAGGGKRDDYHPHLTSPLKGEGERGERAFKGERSSVREKTLGNKFVEAVATSDAVRKVAIAAQEIANSPLNPANLYMKAYNFSNGDGFKTGFEDVVKPETATERAIGAGTRVLFDMAMSGVITNVLADTKYVKQAYDQYRNYYEGRKLGKSYDKLSRNPFKGKAEDVVAVIRPRDKEALYIQRGYAKDKDGLVVTQGRTLRPDTISNFGMNKIMRTHGMTKSEVQSLPRMVRENKPAEVTPTNKQVYHVKGRKGEDYRIASSPWSIKGKERQTLTSFYENGTEKTSVSEVNWTPLPRVYKIPK